MNGKRGEDSQPARASGAVLWLYGQAWEDRSALDGVHPPIPFDEWVQVLRDHRWTVHWTAEGALVAGPYQGGAVVEVDAEGERAYVAVAPECLERLAEVMDAAEYQMVREDVAALENPHGLGLAVTRLDRSAWEKRREVIPVGEPLPTEAWARVIREGHLQVELIRDGALPLDTAWPVGHVVAVTDGVHRYYFAVPRGAVRLVLDLSMEVQRS
jgi:hypothetical protein